MAGPKSPYGRVKIWDTESWVANTDDRVAAVMAANMSTGHDRAVGVYGGNITSDNGYRESHRMLDDNGKEQPIDVTQTWSVAASVGAAQHFLGERDFKEMLFKNGLPWVMLFDGLPTSASGPKDPEDGTIVVVGDLGEEFGGDCLLFRTARGLYEATHRAEKGKLAAALAALPARGADADRSRLEGEIKAFSILRGATLALADAGGRYALYDFYGNREPARGGKIVVPLDGRGFFLRGDGRPGSFAKLAEAVRHGQIEGIEPIAFQALDMTEPIESHPTLRLRLTNVLNRPVTGALSVKLGGLKLGAVPARLTLNGNETRQLDIPIVGGSTADSNNYPLAARFDVSSSLFALHEETLHVNLIAHRTITVNGSLDDWKGVAPQQIVVNEQAGPSLTEAAWLPWKKFDTSVKQGVATAWLAFDDDFFYFAAKAADTTPDPGMLRYETRDEDADFYPPVATTSSKDRGEEKLVWPEGIRRFTYRRDPELPAGSMPNHDNFQIAFNVLPADQKWMYPYPPGTMPGYTGYVTTDYEYALNPVADSHGGGTEIWRLQYPGMPHKHFYPREPKSGLEGAVKGGKLVITRDATTRIVECAIPWSEIPAVQAAMKAAQPIKFSYRVNDNGWGGCMELAKNRSISKRGQAFTVDWAEHWDNELEFRFQK